MVEIVNKINLQNGPINLNAIKGIGSVFSGGIDWSKILQIDFNKKINSDEIEIPTVYKFYDSNGREIIITKEMLEDLKFKKLSRELFIKSVGIDAELRGNENYVLKTPYGFSPDKKLPGDIDYSTDSEGIKNFLYNLKKEKGQIRNFGLTGNMDHKKIEGINKIGDLFTEDGKLKREIEKMIDNGIEINGVKQKIRISYDYLIDLKGSKGITKGSINREIFVEDGTGFLEVDSKNFMSINIDGKPIKMLDPEVYLKYSEDLLAYEMKREISDSSYEIDKNKISERDYKNKILKRIEDYISTLIIINKYNKQNTLGEQDISGKTLEIIGDATLESESEKRKVWILANGLKESIKRRQTKVEDQTIERLKKLSEYVNEALEKHSALTTDPSLEKVFPSISDFMEKINNVKIYVRGYKELSKFLENPNLIDVEVLKKEPFFDEYIKKETGTTNEKDIEENKDEIIRDPEKLKKMISKFEKNYKQSMEELGHYDYSGDDRFHYYLVYFILITLYFNK